MTPERWRQVTAVFHAARMQDPSARRAWLDTACANDPSLRVEVDRMLSAHEAGAAVDGLIMSPPQLKPDDTIGPYRIDGFIGAGGMGQVYRATDTRLKRTVALKILTPELAADADWLARFQREAETLAALNHPHIGAIYSIEDHDHIRALALEYVEGRTLAEIIGEPRPMTTTLNLARQITEALEAAHGRGIIHRDLKPANIKVTPGGIVKVLDFGIAKRSGEDARAGSPAATHTATREGVVIGTAAYMSPEQARGLVVDRRTDIWAFGCVLFELISGTRCFDGVTQSDTIARILEREPDWTAVPAGVPAGLLTLMRRCLRKDPDTRVHDIADARIEIVDTLASLAAAGASIGTRRGQRWPWIAAIAAMITVAIWLGPFRSREPPPAPDVVEFGIRFPDNYIPAFGLAIAPDGRRIAAGIFGASSQLYLHTLGAGDTRPLPGTQNALWPFWSPDGASIGYFTFARELRTLSLATGVSQLVCAVPNGSAGGTWNRDGTILFAADRRLFRVAAAGGDAAEVRLDGEAGEATFPQFLPDQRHFIYFAPAPVGGAVMLGSIDQAPVRKLADADSFGVFVEPNFLVFVRGTALMAQTFDAATGVLSREPVVIASAVMAGSVGNRPLVAATRNVLAYATALGGSVGQLTWFDRSGKAIGVLDQPPGVEYLNPAVSPDGKLVAANRIDPATGNWDVWIVDPGRRQWRLTTDPARDSDPVWSPDGKEIVFASSRGSVFGLYRKDVSGATPETRILSVPGSANLIPNDWSADGRYILFSQQGVSAPGPLSIWMLQLYGDNLPTLLIDNEFSPYAPRISPDGRWLAFNWFETGRQEIYVQRFPEAGQRQVVSDGGGVHPRWTRNGHELTFWAVPAGVNAVDFASGGPSFTIGARRTLVSTPVLSVLDGRTHYDVTRDGTRLLIRQPAGPQNPGITVVMNWMDRVMRR